MTRSLVLTTSAPCAVLCTNKPFHSDRLERGFFCECASAGQSVASAAQRERVSLLYPSRQSRLSTASSRCLLPRRRTRSADESASRPSLRTQHEPAPHTLHTLLRPSSTPPPHFSSQVQLPQVHLGPAEGHLPPRLLCDALQLGRLALAPAARQGEGHVPRGVDEHVLLAPAARADAQRARPSRARPLRSWRRASGRRQRCDTQARA